LNAECSRVWNERQLLAAPHSNHRNLGTRISMLAQVLQIFWVKERLVRNRLISTLDKVIYFKGTVFLWSTKPLFTSQNRVETSWKKFEHFFQHARSVSRFLWFQPIFLNSWIWKGALHHNRMEENPVKRRGTEKQGCQSFLGTG
jgi:hypothetical protein